jgi:UDP-glucose:(heptosyl)LPS alpha-1,3-glucosyltransferase
MSCRVLHVVRRFGPVGGMERYVWRLTSELLELGVEIDILCQSVECDVDPRITLHLLEPSTDRRRWKAMRDFRNKCDQFWLEFKAKDDVIVHSHERCSFHHVTTFHGPPMPALSSLPWYRRMSNRIQFWSKVERCEVSGDDVVRVIPVSNRVRKQLILLYPEQEPRITAPLYPGLDKQVVKPRVLGESREHCGRILFVGREWKRKGLDKAIESISSLNKSDLKVT